MGLSSLSLCLGPKNLDKDSTLNRVMTLQIHSHGGGLEGTFLSWGQFVQLPSLRGAGLRAPLQGQLWGSLACQKEIGGLQGIFWKDHGSQGQLSDNAALSLLGNVSHVRMNPNGKKYCKRNRERKEKQTEKGKRIFADKMGSSSGWSSPVSPAQAGHRGFSKQPASRRKEESQDTVLSSLFPTSSFL